MRTTPNSIKTTFLVLTAISFTAALALVASLGLLLGVAPPAAAVNPNAENPYSGPKLQTDVPGEAEHPDPDPVNGWGISHSATSPWWVSDEGTDKSTLYNGNTGLKLGLVVTVAGGPTGQVFNGSADFVVAGAPSSFIFATESGSIYAWNSSVGTVAEQMVATP